MQHVMVTQPALVNLATTSSMEKQRLAHVSIGHVAMRTLPMTRDHPDGDRHWYFSRFWYWRLSSTN